jgi:hypothetical protein
MKSFTGRQASRCGWGGRTESYGWGGSCRRLTPKAKAEIWKAESRHGKGEARMSGVKRRVGPAGTAPRAIPAITNSGRRTAGRRERFVPCVPGRGVVLTFLVHAHRAMSGSKLLISPAVFKPEKPQARPHRFHGAAVPWKQTNLKCGEICRGKISRPKINPTSKKER